MSRWIRLGAVLVIVLILLWMFMRSQSQPTPGTAHIEFPNGARMDAGLARMQEEKTRGLSGREFLEKDEGLLFIYTQPGLPSYWMKDMLFPIDIIWILDETVVGFEQEAQREEPPVSIYTPKTPVDKVLEVSAGFVKQNDLRIGDRLDIDISAE